MHRPWSEWLDQMGHRPDSPEYEPMRQQVLERARPAPGETVIDVGAGLGLLTFALATRVQPGGRVIAVEPADDCRRKLLETCQSVKGESTVEVRPGRAEALDLEAQTADLLVTRSVLIYVSNKARAFQEFARVLVPGGRMVCWEPINHYFYQTGRLHRWFDLSSLSEIGTIIAEAEESYFGRDDPMCNFTEHDLLYAAESAGFSRLNLSVEHSIRCQTMTLEELQQILGWDTHLAPTYPTFGEWLAQRLSPAQIRALLDVLRQQLVGKELRIEGARALLIGER